MRWSAAGRGCGCWSAADAWPCAEQDIGRDCGGVDAGAAGRGDDDAARWDDRRASARRPDRAPRRSASGSIPVFAIADTPAALNADAVPYSAAPRSPSSSTASRAGASSAPACPCRRRSAAPSRRSARAASSLVRQDRRSPTPSACRSQSAAGPRPCAWRFNASRGSRGASDTKKSLQEYASASAGDSGRFRSGCEQMNVWPSAFTTRRHMCDEFRRDARRARARRRAPPS